MDSPSSAKVALVAGSLDIERYRKSPCFIILQPFTMSRSGKPGRLCGRFECLRGRGDRPLASGEHAREAFTAFMEKRKPVFD